MAYIIGFAEEFYTLWDHNVEPKYYLDAYGKHWHTGNVDHYYYIQNISKDLETAKAKYPGVPIDDGLRGKHNSWSSLNEFQEDPCPHILKFGKYAGHDINKLQYSDLNYCLWLEQNANNWKLRGLVAELPEVKAHRDAQDARRKADLAKIPVFVNGLNSVPVVGNPKRLGEFVSPERAEELGVNFDGFALVAQLDPGHCAYILIDEVLKFEGNWSYPSYYLPVINGKARRIKNKTVQMELEILLTHEYAHDKVQFARMISYIEPKKVRKPKTAL
jgi:hypothetical protein